MFGKYVKLCLLHKNCNHVFCQQTNAFNFKASLKNNIAHGFMPSMLGQEEQTLIQLISKFKIFQNEPYDFNEQRKFELSELFSH